MSTLNAFILGILLGAGSSIVGGFLSYWFGLRQTTQPTAVPLIYLFLIVLLLGFIGLTALVSGVLSGTVMLVLIGGLGVILGFSVVFALLLTAWITFGERTKQD